MLTIVMTVSISTMILIFMAGARDWVWSSLGYGYIPVGLWILSFGLTIRYRRWWIHNYLNLWLGTALMVVAILAALSLAPYPMRGVLVDTGLSGSWGRILGGEPVYKGVMQTIVFLCLVPVVIAPRWTKDMYKRGMIGLGMGAVNGLMAFINLSRWVHRYMPQRSKNLTIEDDGAAGILDEGSVDEDDICLGMSESNGPDPVRQKHAVEKSKCGDDVSSSPPVIKTSRWRLPALSLLSMGETQSVPQNTLDDMASCIETTLSDHGVQVSVKDIKTGPRVIRFGLVPGWTKRNRDGGVVGNMQDTPPHVEVNRVKVHSILARERDLALALKTSDLRIESPVPGESFVGLEVPNPHTSRVFLHSISAHTDFREIAKKGGLPLALGQGTGGEPIAVDLIELPHLLIAGATGSGKSVCINSVIMSLLMSNRPDRLRMLMVDPKRVELTPFNGIPHLLAPVIVNTDEVLKVLGGLLREMFDRYRMLEKVGVRNIDGYNQKSKEYMPYLLLVIDELADLMMAAGFEVEQSLVRLAQLGRATGIHLILCTQRPSVNVVTGLLKANIPARIAFAVSSQVDSRVILDGAGADKLLGKGDMLFLSAQSPKPRRVQGTFVSDGEIDEVIRFWQGHRGPSLPEIPLYLPGDDVVGEAEEAEDDEMLDRARDMAERYGHISPSLLQRRLQIGYTRAMTIIQMLEEDGVVAAGEPGRSRKLVERNVGRALD